MLKRIALVLALTITCNVLPLAPSSASTKTDSQINNLLRKLNEKKNLWEINAASSSILGTQSRQRLGLNQQPAKVIQCRIAWSGTWLFVYPSVDEGYRAASSNYFVRTSAYEVELRVDPKSDFIVLIHTSLGGNQQCLKSANRVLSIIGD